jgi:hypothetical protein
VLRFYRLRQSLFPQKLEFNLTEFGTNGRNEVKKQITSSVYFDS